MSRFSIRNPHFIVVICLALAVIGVTFIKRMPVDLFPAINLPEVVVATFYSGMPPEDIEDDITNPLERWFTLASGIDHMESRSLLGVSIIKVYFQSGTDADADVTELSNLALADLKRLPPGTLPPVVLKFDASSLPVCLVTLKGKGLSEAELHDIGQFTIPDEVATVKGAEIPPPFGGKYRQVMVYVDPLKLFARQLSVTDVVNAVNKNNLILPAGDVKIGPYDYYVYSNALVRKPSDLNSVPLRTTGTRWTTIADVGRAEDAAQIQYNIVRLNGERLVYVPIMKQGGDTNTLDVVDGIREKIKHLFDIPKALETSVIFDQSKYVRQALDTLAHEGVIGLVLTGLIIFIFLGSLRATSAVFLSIPLSALAAFVVLYMMGSTINTMILAGLALAFSRVIDNSVISLENIYRHLEEGALPRIAAEIGGAEVSLAVLAATLVDVVDFFPVTFLYGVSKFLFSALALAFVLSLLASYVVAMTIIPLFCARFLKAQHHAAGGFNAAFNRGFQKVLDFYEWWVRRALKWPKLTVVLLSGVFVASLALFPLLGVAFFPRTDAGQFTVNLKAPTGTRIELTEEYVGKVEDIIRRTVDPKDFKQVLSNIGVVADFPALYTSNAGPYTATVQVELNDDHRIGSFEYMDRVRNAIARQYPELRTFFSSGSMVDAILNMGMPAPIDVQISSSNATQNFAIAQNLASRIRKISGVGEVYIPQDMNYPAMRLNINRVHAAELGLSTKEVVDNVITAINSNYMISPNYWVEYSSGNDYYLTVQYFENGPEAVRDFTALRQMPLRHRDPPPVRAGCVAPPQVTMMDVAIHARPLADKPLQAHPCSPAVLPNGGYQVSRPGAPSRPVTVLGNVADIVPIETPTEADHYQIQRVSDVYVTPAGEDLGKVTAGINQAIAEANPPSKVRVTLRGMVNGMQESFRSFRTGFILSFILLFLILVAQFKSFVDPFLIMLAVPMSFIGVLLTLLATHTTLNVMSLMGVLMLVGIADSNSILIVDFAHRLRAQGYSVEDAAITACRVRLRPILMTSLATIIGMIPMAMKLGTGGEQYTPMARAIIGGLTSSVILTVFIVPAAYLLVYGRKERRAQ
jgi:hydrophobic/amphiphilic exporter-1 (mainly G- bacteria), HAE1 family